MRILAFTLLLILPSFAFADRNQDLLKSALNQHIFPTFEHLADTTHELEQTSGKTCDPNSNALLSAYADAFDAWVKASHLRFGPTEVDDRAFAIAFWPDPKGFTAKSLTKLITTEDPVINDAIEFSEVSIAARGFYSLEFLFWDEHLKKTGSSAYRCKLVQAITRDISANADAILAEWVNSYSHVLLKTNRSDEDIYRTDEEAVQELFKAVNTGLEITINARLGRPLGTFEKPRPRRAEARRSGRSLRHVLLSVEAVEQLSNILSSGEQQIKIDLTKSYSRARDLATALDDPALQSVADIQGRLKVEILQQSIQQIREITVNQLGPALGVAVGFNTLDGD